MKTKTPRKASRKVSRKASRKVSKKTSRKVSKKTSRKVSKKTSRRQLKNKPIKIILKSILIKSIRPVKSTKSVKFTLNNF
jgi:hypothetical protein